MKFIAFEYDGTQDIGILDSSTDNIAPLGNILAKYIDNNTHDLVALIKYFSEITGILDNQKGILDFSKVKLRAPISNPPKNIMCVGKNYFEHAQEFTQSGFDATSKRGDNIPDHPIIFTKPSSAILASEKKIKSHKNLTKQLDYEAELAVIIGKQGTGIKKENAFDHVFGYTIINDITGRDLQLKHRQWFIGKSLDTSCPMGPWITSADEVDAENLNIKCWVNDELRQEANTRDLIFDIPTLIETISSGITLQPGDIISTGTPAGVGIGFDPPRFLSSGDTIRIEIEGLGHLINKVA